jgi:hypothetical protein
VNGTWFNNAVNSALPTSAVQWNSNYDTVNTNSGVWGGSALNISAGEGVKVTLVNNNLVFSTDETVLYSGTFTINTFPAVTVNEPIWNFERIKVTLGTDKVSTGFRGVETKEFFTEDLSAINFLIFTPYTFNGTTLNAVYPHVIAYSGTTNGLTFNPYYAGYHNQTYSGTAAGMNKAVTLQGGRFNTTAGLTYEFGITRVIGINRKNNT